MKTSHSVMFILTILVQISVAHATEPDKGKTLHDANCIECHARIRGGDSNTMYTRTDRRVKDLVGLQKQVQRCKTSVGLAWSEQNVKDVVLFLNKNFYKFPNNP